MGHAEYLRLPKFHLEDVSFARLSSLRELSDRAERDSQLVFADALNQVLESFRPSITSGRKSPDARQFIVVIRTSGR
jgi:hypothetical protein